MITIFMYQKYFCRTTQRARAHFCFPPPRLFRHTKGGGMKTETVHSRKGEVKPEEKYIPCNPFYRLGNANTDTIEKMSLI